MSDLFLRNVLMRNKTNGSIQSIIRTIQEKQNEIRTFDDGKSIIVQGCAGSGKTMVLLHRFKYLKYNGIVKGGDYALLVPSENFKNFIKNTASGFGLYEEDLYTYTEYYRYLLNVKDNKWSEANELNFSDQYLAAIYSEEFIRECYLKLTEYSCDIINETIDFCDEKLSILIAEEKDNIIAHINTIKERVTDKITAMLNQAPVTFGGLRIKKYSDLAAVVKQIREVYCEKESEIKRKISELKNEEVLNGIVETAEETDYELVEMREKIAEETAKYNNASIFTKLAHRFKLNSLKTGYETKKKEVINRAIDEYRKDIDEKTSALQVVNEEINIADLEKLVCRMEEGYASAKRQISDYETQESNYDKKFSSKYIDGIKALQNLIHISTEAVSRYSESAKWLKSCRDIVLYTAYAVKVAKIFDEYKSESKVSISELVEFAMKHESDMYKVLMDKAYKIVKGIVKEKFGVALSKRYKHCWFVQLYFGYLLGGVGERAKKYLFIDEAQDLSPEEIKLLHKVKDDRNGSICNLFGDIKQVISNYGVRDWSRFDFVNRVFELNENFRNTNQIIDYCAKKLDFSMRPVGVSLDEVREFGSFKEMIRADISEKIFVVKDEYAVKDLETLLATAMITDYKAFAVKDAKGLEFKQVIVFDEEMSQNEKYIAYTRALIRLYVVTSSPWDWKERTCDIINDDEE